MSFKPYNQVVLLGDSLFQQSSGVQNGFSFQGALQELCIRKLDVVNRGFSGYNTRNVLNILPQVIAPPSPGGPRIEYLFLLLGANDAVLNLPGTTQHVPIEEYKENLVKILTHEVVKAHSPKIMILTPPPIDEKWCEELDLQRGYQQVIRRAYNTADYAETARKVAAEIPGVQLVDYNKALMDEAIRQTPDFDASGPPLGYTGVQRGGLESLLLPDGLHLNGNAYRVMFETVKEHLPAPGVGTKGGWIWPAWDEL